MRLRSDFMLLAAAFIWGSAFAVQRATANNVGVFWFTGARFLLGALVLLPLAWRGGPFPRAGLKWPLAAGVVLFAGTNLQQLGLRYTTAGNAGFITGLYVVFVPFLLVVLFKERLHLSVWVAAALSTAGLMLLSTGGALSLAAGDAIILAAALFWALHMIVIDRAVEQVDILRLAAGQYLVNAVLNLAAGLLFEPGQGAGLAQSWWAVAYAGVVSVGLGYTLQALAQKHAPPTDTALILSTESVFAALFGYLTLGETLSPLQLLGCALILSAILLVQLWKRRELASNPA